MLDAGIEEAYVPIEEMRRRVAPYPLCGRCHSQSVGQRGTGWMYVCWDCIHDMDRKAKERLHKEVVTTSGKSSLPEGGYDISGLVGLTRKAYKRAREKGKS